MGKLQALEVLFSGNQDVYKPGDTIYGEVKIVVSEEKGDIRGIQIKCVGKSYTHWTETEGSGDNQRTVRYTTKHRYFKQEVTLRGVAKSESNSDRIKLSAGEHRFPFQFQLPSMSLPAPFEGQYGYVRYFVKICIDRPWKFDHHAKRLFSIFTVKDLNYEHNVLVPANHQVEKTVCCLCCASGPIILQGQIDKRGYVPGEYIFVSLDLQNNSSRTIVDIKAKLQQKAHFSASNCGRTHHRYVTKKITELKLDGCEAMGSVNYERMKMLIPPIPPCTYDNCPNIQLEYFVEIEADVSGTPMDAEIKLPVVIGTIPAFQQTLKDPTQAPQGFEAYAPYAGQPIPVSPTPGQPGVYPPPGQPGYPPQGQPGYPPAEQPGYPPSGQPGYPPPAGEPGYPPSGQPGYPPPAEQPGYPPQGQPGYPPTEQPGYPPSGQPGYPPPAAQPGYPLSTDPSSGLPPPPTYAAAVGGPQEITGKEGSFGSVMYAPHYPYYDPDTLYAAMGLPAGAPTSTDGGPPPPTITQPQSGQQPSYNPYPEEKKGE
nr:arrestin domain-containing protein 3-like [Lytechinus pictus]